MFWFNNNLLAEFFFFELFGKISLYFPTVYSISKSYQNWRQKKFLRRLIVKETEYKIFNNESWTY